MSCSILIVQPDYIKPEQLFLTACVVLRKNVLNTYMKCCSTYGIKNAISMYNHYANMCIICLLFCKGILMIVIFLLYPNTARD